MIDPLGDAEVPGIDDETTPAEAHDLWEAETNLDAAELRAVEGAERNDAYLDEASDGRETSDPPIPGGPLADAIHLAETPADQWGSDEKAEAREALNYKDRTIEQYGADEGEPLLADEEPDMHTGEWALVRWGMAPEPEDAEEVLK
jgi:hypothetical protein